MKLSKKIVLVSAAALMTLGPVAALTQNNEPVFAASKKAAKNTIKTSVGDISLYNSKGKAYTGKLKIKSNSTVKTYGNPVWITRTTSLLSGDSFPVTIIKDGQRYVWLGDKGYIKSNCLGSINNKGVINIARNGYVYDKNGKRLKSYRGGKATVTRNQKIKYAGKLTKSSRDLYYYVGSGAYVQARDISQVAGKNVMFLNYNTYVYNKKGQRIKSQGTLKKGTLLAYNGSAKTASSSDDFYFYPSATSIKNPQALKQYKIKGQVYYALGGGRYIKALNISKINGQYVFTKQPTYVVPHSDMHVLNKNLKETSKIVRAGSKVKIDQVLVANNSTDPQLYVRLAGTKDQFLYWSDAGEYPNEEEGSFSFRFFMDDNHSFEEETQSLITFNKGLEKTTPLYNDQGQLIDLGGKYLQKQAQGNFMPENSYQVDYARYIWVPSEKKAELFYHLVDTSFSMHDPNGKYNYAVTKQNVGNVYVKASDVTFKGVKVKTQNTAEEAAKLAEK